MKKYDAVFVGRFHYTKGIKEMMEIWEGVMKLRKRASLVIIGGGDSEEKCLKAWARKFPENVYMLGYVAANRFKIYKQSRIVLYPTPIEYSHFSMGPVEAMACGCPLVAFKLPVLRFVRAEGLAHALTIDEYIRNVLILLWNDPMREQLGQCAARWASKWDWKVRAPAILQQIRGAL